MDEGWDIIDPELLGECLSKLMKQAQRGDSATVLLEKELIRGVLALHRPGTEDTGLPELILSRIRALRMAALSGHFSEWCWSAGTGTEGSGDCFAVLRPLVAAASHARLHLANNRLCFHFDELRELAIRYEERDKL